MQCRPSSLFDDADEPLGPMARYCLDGAVVAFGVTVENALHETVELGSGKHKTRRARWTLSEILQDDFTLPRRDEKQASIDSLKGIDGAYFDEVS